MVHGEKTGIIFNIQKFSVHDGPGIRTTVFMKGCPLRCHWCANAEAMNPEPELGIIRSRCNNCGKCLQVCPEQAISFNNDDIIPELIGYGLQGIEAIHPLHTPLMQSHYKELCFKHGLVYTGGSDWHGKGRGRSYVSLQKIPREVLDELYSRSALKKKVDSA